MTSSLELFMNRVISVITGDGRNIIGMLKGFDQLVNLVLEDSHERVYSETTGVEQIPLGLYIIRGDNVAVVGEIDEELDKRIDLSNLKAAPLAAIWIPGMSDTTFKQIAKDDELIRDEVEQIDWSEDCTSSQDAGQQAVEDFDLEELECVDEEGEEEIINNNSSQRHSSPKHRDHDVARKTRILPNEDKYRDHYRIERKRKISSPSRRERDRRRREDYFKKRKSTNSGEKTSFEELEEVDCIEEETDTDSVNTDRIATPSDDSRGVESDMAACSWSDRTPDKIASIEEESDNEFDEFPDLCEDIDVEAAVRAACLPLEPDESIVNLAETTKDIPFHDETVPTNESMLVDAATIGDKDRQGHGAKKIEVSEAKDKDVRFDSRRRRLLSPVRRRNRSRDAVVRTPSPIRRRLKPPPGRREEQKSDAKRVINNASSERTIEDTSQPSKKGSDNHRRLDESIVDPQPMSSSLPSLSTDFVASRVEMRRFIADLHVRNKSRRKDDYNRNRGRSSATENSQPIFKETKKKCH